MKKMENTEAHSLGVTRYMLKLLLRPRKENEVWILHSPYQIKATSIFFLKTQIALLSSNM